MRPTDLRVKLLVDLKKIDRFKGLIPRGVHYNAYITLVSEGSVESTIVKNLRIFTVASKKLPNLIEPSVCIRFNALTSK